MLARGLISREQYEAGCQYATLYIQTVAPATVSVASLYRRLLAEGGGGQEIDEEDLRRLQALFRLGKNRLLAAGRRVTAATENIAVFARPARFLSRSATMTLKRGADFAELQAVLDGSRLWSPATAGPESEGGWRCIERPACSAGCGGPRGELRNRAHT
jgi:hypothetical protein